MAKDLEMGVITEGVETQQQIDMLADLGCNMFQGFYFSKPIPVKEFELKYT
jgi:EAL domain-containing protein (putative c-di-GMP-specific phosphodiesterase class I)